SVKHRFRSAGHIACHLTGCRSREAFMFNRIISTLALALSLLCSSAGLSQSQSPVEGGLDGYSRQAEQTNQRSGSSAGAHWWDRFSPPAKDKTVANNAASPPMQ